MIISPGMVWHEILIAWFLLLFILYMQNFWCCGVKGAVVGEEKLAIQITVDTCT